ncbi:hypothetical protein J2T58_002005 [Methanocalculus alkaliphilus]|uniref:hypothetical protein n=1 Tax=Methanocalculus alkaliphilus TaxID=768730 RepID=UPI0020A1FA53|nr:hypothetical protein [Methanocalculus alkaliphilus]MCP1716130.1 hypothetical protein [Methanocalculus alkaliphilus]
MREKPDELREHKNNGEVFFIAPREIDMNPAHQVREYGSSLSDLQAAENQRLLR